MDPIKIIEKYYTPTTPLYNILLSHSRSVTNKALEIAQRHPEIQMDTTFIAEAAMVHDIGIFLTNAPAIHCIGNAKYIEHGYLGADLMRQEGFERHALVCERHTGTGLSLEEIKKQRLPLPHRNLCPISYEEQVICFADKFFSKTHLEQELPIEKIISSLSTFGDTSVLQFKRWLNMFG